MPKYDITVTFDLETSLDPDFYGHRWDEGVTLEGIEDGSYFSTQHVTVDGGSLSFQVEATDEGDAESKAFEVIQEGSEVEDTNGWTWVAANVSVEVEPVEEPMDLVKATELVTAYLMDQELPEELKEAFRFILSRIS